MKPELESILRRIQKLLAIATDGRADANEAAAAASMAENIMRKYQIEHADLVIASVKDDLTTADAVASAKTNGTRVAKVPLWADWMALAVARLNDCGAMKKITESGDLGIRFAGYSADVQVAVYMFNYLVNAVLTHTNNYRIGLGADRKQTNSFRKGMAVTITRRLEAMAKDKQAEMVVATSGRELMIIKKDSIEEKFGADIFKVVATKSKTSNYSAYAQGVIQGAAIDIDRRGIKSDASSTPSLN